MSASLLFLLVSLCGAGFTAHAMRPVRFAYTIVPAFFASWLTIELAPQHLVWQVAATAGFVWAGALGHWPGWVGLAVSLVSWAGLLSITTRARLVGDGVDHALREGLGGDYTKRIAQEALLEPAVVALRNLALPFRFSRRDVERVRNLSYGPYGRRNRLDVYRSRAWAANSPTLVWVHGGGWVIGNKDQQGLPMLHALAARGWVCFSINYRLSPKATWPDHIVDVKRALAWVRGHGAEYGADPGFILLSGDSAGGHLAALAGLSANDPEYQPGFEDADTSVQACMPFYGVYDVLERHPYRGARAARGFRDFFRRAVMKVSPDDDPGLWHRASPLDRVRPDAPPFFAIHGDHDLLVPVGQAREFVRALRSVSQAPVTYLELPGTQHAFEVFHSIRTTHVVRGVERFGAWAYAAWLARAQPVPAEPATPAQESAPAMSRQDHA